MLLLLFETSDGRYALDSRDVVEIIPLVIPKKITAAPAYVAGIINYRGEPVPVFDLCALADGTPCKHLYSTRIILVRYPLAAGRKKLVGLIAERVTDVIKSGHTDLGSSGILIDEALNSSAAGAGNDEIIQKFDLQGIIPEDIVRELFKE
ncbi:MAG: chemotaxis protein CheW [Deltaproteobacteria bacterium]|nr:chemotaxis protein CheW [Deltaproteobacteria bacterium]